MDMIMVDITDIECNEGDPVFIFKTQEDILNILQNYLRRFPMKY